MCRNVYRKKKHHCETDTISLDIHSESKIANKVRGYLHNSSDKQQECVQLPTDFLFSSGIIHPSKIVILAFK